MSIPNLPLKFVAVSPIQNGVFLITLNKPQTGNSMHPRLTQDLLTSLQWADQQSSIRVIVVTGAGKFFCTGMELVERGPMAFGPDSTFRALNRLLILTDKILIAAVNGPAVGYGVTSLGLFDLVYSVPDAYFFTPFVKWGMTTEGCSSITFPRMMGHQKAALLCLAGDRIDANEASGLGLVSKVLPNDGFLNSVLGIANNVAKSSPGSLATTKRLMKTMSVQDLLDANDRECEAFEKERIPSGDLELAIKTFAEEQKEKQKAKSKL
ncbi:hypothetical protein PV10_01472 [Exophiala mesophila]|uniref:Enoyl-CoA hydratase n=1 Tax=Exophiala mesophila TaxID=212818 RepID=A0A0D1ZUV3_EXOME|nr:uncharacterized protein PV10_01472 [Exophiala mesophila]KIV97764.1 hypothetical protein PV10_01472 [Exophiala mesophila]